MVETTEPETSAPPAPVGEGEECNGSLPPQHATFCDEGLECVRADESATASSSGRCVAVVETTRRSTMCVVGGVAYQIGESWVSPQDACSINECSNGETVTVTIHCSLSLRCDPGVEPVHLEGECCATCPPTPTTEDQVPPTDSTGYRLSNTGNCDGDAFIETSEQCEIAAVALGLEPYMAATNARYGVRLIITPAVLVDDYPHGCSMESDTVFFNSGGDRTSDRTPFLSICVSDIATSPGCPEVACLLTCDHRQLVDESGCLLCDCADAPVVDTTVSSASPTVVTSCSCDAVVAPVCGRAPGDVLEGSRRFDNACIAECAGAIYVAGPCVQAVPPTDSTGYRLSNTGKCDGDAFIETSEQCEIAAVALGLEPYMAATNARYGVRLIITPAVLVDDYPHGCSMESDTVFFNSGGDRTSDRTPFISICVSDIATSTEEPTTPALSASGTSTSGISTGGTRAMTILAVVGALILMGICTFAMAAQRKSRAPTPRGLHTNPIYDVRPQSPDDAYDPRVPYRPNAIFSEA